jgi:hypothetical protein
VKAEENQEVEVKDKPKEVDVGNQNPQDTNN